MHSSSILLFSSVTILFVIFYHFKCEARDSIDNETSPLIGSTGETLVSAGNKFELGFFTPEGNEKGNEYIGIWYYNMTPRTIVWVVRQDIPLNDSSRVFGIAEDGNLKLWYSNGRTPFFVTNLEPSRSFNRTLQLLDSGNLRLFDSQSENTLWQSFDFPSDTFLPGMKMDVDTKLSSWLSPSDPALGNYVFERYETVYRIRNRSSVYWASGEPGLPMMPSYMPSVVQNLLIDSGTVFDQTNDQLLDDRKKSMVIPYNHTRPPSKTISRLLMTSLGKIEYHVADNFGRWYLRWSEPLDSCNVHKVCGAFATCDDKNKPKCNCLSGYNPVSTGDWNSGKYSEGCVGDNSCKTMDNKMEQQNKFKNLGWMRVGGEFIQFNLAQDESACQTECLDDCKCNAYLYAEENSTSKETGNTATKCWISKSDMINLKKESNHSLKFKLSIREPFQAIIAGSTEGVHENKAPSRYVVVFFMCGGAGVVLVLCCCYLVYRRTAKGEENQQNIEESPALFTHESEGRVTDLMDEKEKKGIDVPFYDFDAILSATDNFSDANKLGQGGFGPVYKGKFRGGQEIAVKRLSCCSSQGIKEFQNEVVLIAKLQHRNLVRLLGYCIKGNEKILLYEYMPNRSLDAFIFDQSNCMLLDWRKRFEIILGIARGLLYLHQDSRLRIVHRDLKTSNILLDEDMNPKISDFGLARIIEGKGTEASTNKVVGTFGYMSPEYALEGKFSTKSDVYSFGVLVLEIISGKRNTAFYQPQEVLTLLGFAWRLWSENKALDLADPTVVVMDSCNKSQVLKCIHVGLLCVQEDPGDRPAMSNVVIMLESETSPLQPPTQPAFVVRRRHSSTSSTTSSKPDTGISNNELTISMVQGR